MKSLDVNLEQYKAVAFDFDGVIHNYSRGWCDGSIYDDYNGDVMDLILVLMLAKIPVFILSTRSPEQIKDWWDKQRFSIQCKVLRDDITFFNDLSYVGVTNRKLPAQLYIDDRAYRYRGQTVGEFFTDLSENWK